VSEGHWSEPDLTELHDLEELVLVIGRVGYETIRVPVWEVVVDDQLYVRSFKGVTSMWFRRVQADADQAIRFGDADVPVHFENVDRLDHVNHAINAEFDRKYARFNYVTAMSEPAAVEATVRLLPR
jgi:hypothetical protein